MKPGPKITEAQRTELLEFYLKHGYLATKPLAESMGVSHRYPAQLARSKGYTGNYQPTIRTSKDTRWLWAKQRGAVLA